MSWAWGELKDFALGCAIIFWVFAFIGLARMSRQDPLGMLRAICGGLAVVFATLALLWIAHLSDKYL
jgi:hypothetical protein